MNNDSRMPFRPALRALGFFETVEAMRAESASLADTWFVRAHHPSPQLRLIADTLAQSILVRLAADIEEIWNSTGRGVVTPHLHHFEELTTLVLLLEAPQRQRAVRLRALAFWLLKRQPWSADGRLGGVFTDFSTTPPLEDPCIDAREALPFARRVAERIGERWTSELHRLITATDIDVLPSLEDVP